MKQIWKDIYMNQQGIALFDLICPNADIRPLLNTAMRKRYLIKHDGSGNIIIVRNKNKISNLFDDLLFYIRLKDGVAECNVYSVTSDPGTWYLLNGLSKGTAILKPQYVKDMFKLGLHKGQYKALVQNNKCWVIRDFNRDRVLDFDWNRHSEYSETSTTKRKKISTVGGYVRHEYFNNNELVRREEYGNFGINLHRSNPRQISTIVDKWSAGCVVLYAGFAYDKFMVNITSEARPVWDMILITAYDCRT